MDLVLEAGFVRRGESSFPERLLPISPEVKELYYRGTWRNELFTRTVAVVGSRRMSQYGKQVVGELAPRLVAAGYTVISGFMYGIDIEVHRKVLVEGGRMIAVLGHGIDYTNDIQKDNLYYKFLERGGLFVAEWKNCIPKPHTYLLRNRIVVGLSDAVIVVEAGETSGSLHSAEWAVTLGKKLFAVPGSINSPVSAGTNALIASGKAEPLTWNTLEAFLGTRGAKNYPGNGSLHQTKKQLNESERTLITLLRLAGPLSTHEIARHMSGPTGSLMSRLTELEMAGYVSQERGEWKVL